MLILSFLIFSHVQAFTMNLRSSRHQWDSWWLLIAIMQRKQRRTWHFWCITAAGWLFLRCSRKQNSQRKKEKIQLLDDLTGDRNYKELRLADDRRRWCHQYHTLVFLSVYSWVKFWFSANILQQPFICNTTDLKATKEESSQCDSSETYRCSSHLHFMALSWQWSYTQCYGWQTTLLP